MPLIMSESRPVLKKKTYEGAAGQKGRGKGGTGVRQTEMQKLVWACAEVEFLTDNTQKSKMTT